jgi:small subunit ribosomal protein S13
VRTPSINKGKDKIMARIVGVDIPRNKKVAFSLCYIHGIGMSTALEICKTAKINTDKRVQELSEKQVSSIREVISSLEINVEGELRSFNAMNIKRLKDVGAYRGLRHRRGLPANGQRTKTNARTRKGKKRTIGLGKKAI